jgi:two-component system chemotaxis response regulator CheY
MGGAMNILLVDDDILNRRLLEAQFSRFGECDTASDGEEAILAFKSGWDNHKPYDLICMDIMMPNVDGREALKRIRQIENDLGIKDEERAKVIMITALEDADAVVGSYEEGATAYLVKPVTLEKAANELERLGLINQGE